MILAIISAVLCFAVAVLIYTPYFRKIPLIRPIALYFVYEGGWILASNIVLQLDPANDIILNINYIVTIVFMLYYMFFLFMTKRKSKRKFRKAEKERKV